MPQIIRTPSVRLISRPQIDGEAVFNYLSEVGGESWFDRVFFWPEQDRDVNPPVPNSSSSAEALIEFCAKLCYRAWAPGLNANVTKVRDDSAEYLRNILGSGHGSVLEHANFTFVITNVSRVFTHELVRHRIGTAFSQESMRFVRLTEIPFWFPDWASEDDELMSRCLKLLEQMEQHQRWMASWFALDDEGVDFAEKKHKTSFMRRFAPDGVATSIVLTANIRAIRHMIEMRTDTAAEEEIRLIFNEIGDTMIEECPLLFGDYVVSEDGCWSSKYRKV